MHFDLKIHINFKQKICRTFKDKTMSVGMVPYLLAWFQSNIIYYLYVVIKFFPFRLDYGPLPCVIASFLLCMTKETSSGLSELIQLLDCGLGHCLRTCGI